MPTEPAPATTPTRCPWCEGDPLLGEYHDREWGVPITDPQLLFEALLLDSFQAGLAWITVLRKREAFRRAFAGFQPQVMAGFGEAEIAGLLQDAGIIRHRGKIEAAVAGARAWLEIEAREGFADFIWRAVDGRPVQNRVRRMEDMPDRSPASERLARDLRAVGFRFLGPVSVYAFMQGAGLVNDHLVGCFRHRPVAALAAGVER